MIELNCMNRNKEVASVEIQICEFSSLASTPFWFHSLIQQPKNLSAIKSGKNRWKTNQNICNFEKNLFKLKIKTQHSRGVIIMLSDNGIIFKPNLWFKLKTGELKSYPDFGQSEYLSDNC